MTGNWQVPLDLYNSAAHHSMVPPGTLVIAEDVARIRRVGLFVAEPFAGVILLEGADAGRMFRVPDRDGVIIDITGVAELVVVPFVGEPPQPLTGPLAIEMWREDQQGLAALAMEYFYIGGASGNRDTRRFPVYGKDLGPLARSRASERLVGTFALRAKPRPIA